NRQQLLILLLSLIGVEDEHSMPPVVAEIFDRGQPRTAREFLLFTIQLKQDVLTLRVHLKQLADRDPAFAESLRNFKADLLKPLQVPTTYVVKPITYYSKGRVLPDNQPYYRIEDYA